MSTRRDTTIDVAKGLAIIAIVFGHIHRGMWASGLGTEALRPYKFMLDYGVYFWHLVVFAFLSGLFVSRGALKTTPSSYLTKRLVLFGYLYVIWQVLQVGMKLVLPSNSSDKTTVMSLLELWKPEGQLWFFPWLMIVTIIAVLGRVWQKDVKAYVIVAVCAILAVAFWGYSGDYVGTQGISLAVFFMLGVALGHEKFQAMMESVSLAVHAVIAVVGLVVYTVILVNVQAAPPTVVPYFANNPAAVAVGIVASLLSSLAVLSTGSVERLARLPGTPLPGNLYRAHRVRCRFPFRTDEVWSFLGTSVPGGRYDLCDPRLAAAGVLRTKAPDSALYPAASHRTKD